MSDTSDQSESDAFWGEVMAENPEIGTIVFLAIVVAIAFALDVIGFEGAVVAMLGLIAAASATE